MDDTPEDFEKLMTPFVIVLVAAIITAISAAIVASAVTPALPERAAAFAGIGAAFGGGITD